MRRVSVKKLIAAATVAAAFGSGCVSAPMVRVDGAVAPSVPAPVSVHPISTAVFVDAQRMHAAWTGISSSTASVPGTVVAGVVNHHVFASDLLADFFHRLKIARPDAVRIIILSPDHYHAGRNDVSTGVRPYQTPDGDVEIDATMTRALVNDGFATEESALFDREHGIGALIPFLRHEFSDVRIVPLVIRDSIRTEKSVALGRRLAGLADDRTLVIISSDMSHDLSEAQALTNDVKTKKALEALDSNWFDDANDDFTDNGASFVILRSYLDAQKVVPTFTLFGHAISSNYGGPKNDTTSYFTGVWSR